MHPLELGDNLRIRAAETDGDVNRCAAFNARFNGAYEGATYRLLHTGRPYFSRGRSLYVEDARNGEVAATACLIPWDMDYGGARLNASQLEMVLSHPEYRKKGLVRRLIQRLEDENVESDVNIIWGIPYYYRQYGYGYCMYGPMNETLPAVNIPDTDGDAENPYALQKATAGDAAALARFYAAETGRYQICLCRDEAYWRFLIDDAKHPVWVVRDRRKGADAGFVTVHYQGEGAARVMESGGLNGEAALNVLRLIKRDADKTVYVGGPEDNALVKTAKDLGSVAKRQEQWLVKLPDIPGFFTKTAAVFEQRLASAGCAGETFELVINLYKTAYRLAFTNGRFAGIEGLGFKDYSMGAFGGDLCIPPEAFTRLVFGFRTLPQLTDAWPDVVLDNTKKYLTDALFPPAGAYIYAPIHYCGKV